MSARKPLLFLGISIGLGLVLLAVGFLAQPGMKPTKKLKALNQAFRVETAVNTFFTDYEYLPGNKERIKTAGPDGILFLRVLLGLERVDNPLNTRGVKYLIEWEGETGRNGLIYTKTGDDITGMFDPWGNPYVVLLNTDNDGKLAFRWGDRQVELKGRRVAVFSPGPDGKEGTADDVRTW